MKQALFVGLTCWGSILLAAFLGVVIHGLEERAKAKRSSLAPVVPLFPKDAHVRVIERRVKIR